jgi:hypothetical protein
VACLDDKRLQKQAVETYQILLQLLELRPVREGPPKKEKTVGFERPAPRFKKDGTLAVPGWGNHPMIRMWRGYEPALVRYQVATCAELLRRPTKTGKQRSVSVLPLTTWALYEGARQGRTYDFDEPAWLGQADLHASHRGRLLHKHPAFYARFGWSEAPISEEVGYVWPR